MKTGSRLHRFPVGLLAASIAATCAGSASAILHEPHASARNGEVVRSNPAAAAPPLPQSDQTRSTVVVTHCDDSGPGSLREAYFNAVDGDTIDLSQLACSRITLTTGALTAAANDVTLNGPGADRLAIDGSSAGRVLVHTGDGKLEISGLTITNGKYRDGPYGGGCIYAQHNLVLIDSVLSSCMVNVTGDNTAFGGGAYVGGGAFLTNSVVTGNTARANAARAYGGGVWARSVVLSYSRIVGNVATNDDGSRARGGGLFAWINAGIAASTISGNRADTDGGGAFLAGEQIGHGEIEASTISDNEAQGWGGGVFAALTDFEISNSTISGNRGGQGGGIAFNSHSAITHSTVTGNQAFSGAGLFSVGGMDVTLRGSVVAGNSGREGYLAADIAADNDQAETAGTRNLVGTSTIALPNDTLHDDPRLGPLQDNGGPTATHALLDGSPAIDRGGNSDLPFDQRGAGFSRVVGASADIGAFEFGPTDRVFADGFDH